MGDYYQNYVAIIVCEFSDVFEIRAVYPIGNSSSFGMETSCPNGIKLFSCSTYLSMKFQLLLEAKMLNNNVFFFPLKHSDVVSCYLMLKCQQLLAF